MTIETKYNVGDEVWFVREIHPNNYKADSGIVEKVRVSGYAEITAQGREVINIHYEFCTQDSKTFDAWEIGLYPTKADLLNSL